MSKPKAAVGAVAASTRAAAPPAAPAASVDQAVIRDRFNFEWCMDPDNGAEGDTYWWWARSVRIDPNEIIADDGEGALWSIPFSTDGLSNVTFGAPQRVAETFVPVAAGEGAAATAVVQRRRQKATAFERPDKPDPTTAASATTTQEATTMDVDASLLRSRLGLADDASEEQITEALNTEPSPTPAPEATEHTPGAEEPVPASGPAPAAPSVPQEAAASIRSTLGLPSTATDEDVARAAQELRDGAAAGSRVARDLQVRELDTEASAAVDDGRIPPSAHDSWRSAIDPGENPTAESIERAQREREALAALPANRIPVKERGGTPPAATDNSSLQRALQASRPNRATVAQGEVMRRG